MTTQWNYADVWEAIAEETPEVPALVHGAARISWREFDQRADGLAKYLLGTGVEKQDKVALYVYNGLEYLQGVFAALKIGLVPVNTNYRYRQDELLYLWDNGDVVAVIFHGAFVDTIEQTRAQLPRIRAWLWVDDGSGPCPEWAVPFETAVETAGPRARAPWGRSGDDIIMIYTGGTTGLPKGVMWRQDDLFRAYDTTGASQTENATAAARSVVAMERPVALPACPLMHGTGFVFAIQALVGAGTIVTLTGRSFDVVELLDTIEREKINSVAIVGDAFCRPMVDALDAEPQRWNLSHLKLVISSGVMWSAEVKERLLAHVPEAMFIDVLGSTEAHSMGRAVYARGGASSTAKFVLGDHAFVVDDEGRPLAPGSGQIGRIAVRGFVPVGYYKDPKKTAETFVTIDGARCSIAGDYATVEADGSITLLGRGSVCINTGGEKVFPEEVEEALKTHPAVRDVTVVGVPDTRFGEAIAAAVELHQGRTADAGDLIAYAKQRIAGYKAPRHLMFVDTVGRAVNGKADYAGVRRRVVEWLAAQST